MRFQVSRALDAIESRMRTDPLLTGAVVDLSEAVHLPGPDGRPANLLRLGFVIDALSRHLSDESVALYAVGDRGVLSDTDLTSNERMALRRWSDDGFVEIIPSGTPVLNRVCEIAWNLGLPVITGRALAGFPGGKLVPAPTQGSMTLVEAGKVNPPPRQPILQRVWRCPVADCPSFPARGPQSPPLLGAGAGIPLCPRHAERLSDLGQRPQALALALRVDGLAKYRFPLVEGVPLTVGRCPEGAGAVGLGPYLTQHIGARISRNHVRVELRDSTVVVTDISSNGTLIRRAGAVPSSGVETMTRGRPAALGEWDVVELAEGVELGRADRRQTGQSSMEASSVMQDAPTVAIRLPKR